MRPAATRAPDEPRADGVPRLPGTYIPRKRLAERLDRASTGSVTLLVAPAGAGKTLGVAGWVRGSGGRGVHDVAWVRAHGGWDAGRLEELLDRSAGTDAHGPRLTVVDDAHLLPLSALRVIDHRLDEGPGTMRLLLLSRWDLPLTRLVPELLGQLTVLRGGILRLDDGEAAELVAAHVAGASSRLTRALTNHAEGWCAALVLTARAASASPDPVAAAEQYAASDVGVADRVASDVFAALAPAERHLLLSAAAEDPVLPSEAAALSHDPRAGEILAHLASTGLLVTRLDTADRRAGREAQALDEPVYRIHPLLHEVVRRRLAVGGVDVARARATVARAARLSIARGEVDRAFERLVAVHEAGAAADVLAAHGVAIVVRGRGLLVTTFLRRHPEVVEGRHDTWFPLALERWLAGDVEGARPWMDRVLARHPGSGGEGPGSHDGVETVACIRLMRARLGTEPMRTVLDAAELVVHECTEGVRPEGDPGILPLLLVELGTTQGWAGDLERAETNLSAAVALCRARRLHALAACALSHLALVRYMAGQERGSRELAAGALRLLDVSGATRFPFTAARASLTTALARAVDLPLQDGFHELRPPVVRAHPADLCTLFWRRMLTARAALARGRVAEAERVLSTPLELPVSTSPLPDHLHVALLVEQAFLAALSVDDRSLGRLEQQLSALAAPGEAMLVGGLRADLAGDLRGAASRFAAAADAVTYPQPASRELALTCEAQLLDALGDRTAALERLRAATTSSEVRRNAVPFLGWTRLGTPVQALLRRLASGTPASTLGNPSWVHELASAAAGRPGAREVFATTTATPRERDAVEEPSVVQPSLSPREREVLLDLARGATYADIAADLFVSENTVKSHVSSLYGKLAVSRRSEALAVARKLQLL